MKESLCAGVGRSVSASSHEAGREAALEALERAGGSASLAIVYATVMHDQQALIDGIRAVLGEVPLVGGSTQGVSTAGRVEECSWVVGVAVVSASPRIRARTIAVQGFSADPHAAGLALAEGLAGAEGPLLLWYDPLTGGNVTELLRGLEAGGFPRIVGGGAGQPWGPLNHTYQYHDGVVLQDAAVAMAIEGDVILIHDVTNGTESLGIELEVTEAAGHILKQIDGQPALEVWTEQLGGGPSNNVEDTASWALGVALPEALASHGEELITRAVFGFRHDTKELVLQASIETGSRLQLCHRTPDAVYERALQMATRLQRRCAPYRPLLALSFECGARPRPFLGDPLAAQEVTQMQEILGDPPWLGTYAWGEIAPVGAHSYLHNYTFPLVILAERS